MRRIASHFAFRILRPPANPQGLTHRTLSAPVQIGTFDFAKPFDDSLHLNTTLTCTESGVSHGMLVWMDMRMAADGGLLPGAPGSGAERDLQFCLLHAPPTRLQAGLSIALEGTRSLSQCFTNGPRG